MHKITFSRISVNVRFWRIFFTTTIIFEGRGRGEGREGFLLVNNLAELMMMGCKAWFESKRRYLPTWLANIGYKKNNGAANIKKIKKGRCGKHLSAPTLFGSQMTGVIGKRNRINTIWKQDYKTKGHL
jgi:hypothetical protein